MRVCCVHGTTPPAEFAVVKWFAPPQYPDNDPLTVRIALGGAPAPAPLVLSLDQIDPSRIMFEIDSSSQNKFMMRIEGVDVMPGDE